MTDMQLALPFLIVAALGAGCRPNVDKVPNGSFQDAASASQLGNGSAAREEAVRAVEDYAYISKDEFVAKMNRDMGGLHDDLNVLAAKAESAGDAARVDAVTKLAAAREQWAKTKLRLDQVANATAATWTDTRQSFKEAFVGLNDAVDTARHWFSEKIAP
jgi:hypothetical protein